ncbi:hypothetical protein FBZ94_105124 [Bradyrhizobium sacchari]|uniref:Uncharacterized protein n=1 Tax=Bradyrhizobium sacchari TaxID=1399419 RepID=A0A560IIH6_9BRAD|nr:hypothetical protein FBZ94_105124 [Bradyrhizobium sacchari]TWB72792.1 hypothetical protein FBZ95_106507 [Bradyrhizobium sacchari]
MALEPTTVRVALRSSYAVERLDGAGRWLACESGNISSAFLRTHEDRVDPNRIPGQSQGLKLRTVEVDLKDSQQ